MSTKKQLEMIYAAREVGSIAEMSSPATASFTHFLERNAMEFEDLTIRQVIAFLEVHRKWHEGLSSEAVRLLAPSPA